MESYQIFSMIYVVEAWFDLDELLAVSQEKVKYSMHTHQVVLRILL